MAVHSRIELDADCGRAAADSLKEALVAAPTVTVSAGHVMRISTAVLQVLVAASLDAVRRGGSFLIDSPSDPFRAACVDLGLGDWLDQWSKA